MKKLTCFLAVAFVACLSSLLPVAVSAQVIRPGATTLIVQNVYSNDVTVMVTVPGAPCAAPCVQSDGCPNGSLQSIRYLDITAGAQPAILEQFGNTPSQGWFVLKAGHKVQLLNVGLNPITHQVSSCFQGMLLGFGQIGNSCPDFGPIPQHQFPNVKPGPNFNLPIEPMIPLPNGSNAFECTLNLPGTVNGGTTVFNPHPTGLLPAVIPVPTAEGIDISCVNGANSVIEAELIPPMTGPFWTSNLGPAVGGAVTFYQTTTCGPNSWVDIHLSQDDNCVDPHTGHARPGVFPYGCSQCNTKPDPAPPCKNLKVNGVVVPGPGQFCAAKNGLPPNNGCLFNRNTESAGIQKFGGTVQVVYRGPTSPP